MKFQRCVVNQTATDCAPPSSQTGQSTAWTQWGGTAEARHLLKVPVVPASKKTTCHCGRDRWRAACSGNGGAIQFATRFTARLNRPLGRAVTLRSRGPHTSWGADRCNSARIPKSISAAWSHFAANRRFRRFESKSRRCAHFVGQIGDRDTRVLKRTQSFCIFFILFGGIRVQHPIFPPKSVPS